MTAINIPAILIANIMGLTILFVIAAENSWQTRKILSENKGLKTMFYVCVASCIAEPVCFLADGKPGFLNFILVYGCNTWLFIGNIIIALTWLQLLTDRFGIPIPALHRHILVAEAIFDAVLLIINAFVPVVFSISENNVYARASWYWVYSAFYFVVIFYGLGFYMVERFRSGRLKFFPVWAFIVPAVIGMLIQFAFYGVSTITPFVTVSLVCIFTSLQGEFIYRDKLTGLYNRFFLDIFEEKAKKNTKQPYTMMMLDLNGFKKINDTYGHTTGDQALIQASDIFRAAVGANGEVIRYAGDEFILILSTQDDCIIEDIIAKIHQAMTTVSKREDIPYELSVSLGYSKLQIGQHNRDEFLDKIDKLMYADKRSHYESNPQNDRRGKQND